jgi:hypothetical protein
LANIFTQNPVFIDTDTTTGAGTNWRGASGGAQLNPGNLPSNIQQTSGVVTRQWGIRPVMIIVEQAAGAVATVAGDIVITDPQTTGGGGQLLKIPIIGTTQTPIVITVFPQPLWRDFIVTGVSATKTSLQIFYKA